MKIEEQLQIGFQHHQAGRLRAAEEVYRRMLAFQPEQPDALHLLGVIALQTGNWTAALDLISRAIALFPDKAEYHTNIGLALVELNRMDEGVAAYRRALELNPDSGQTRNNLGNALAMMGRPDEALAELRRAMAIEPSSAQTAFNLGNVLEGAGKREEALEYFRRAVALRPDWREALNNLGHALCRVGRFAEAEEVYQDAVAKRPQCPLSHFNLGISFLRNGELARGWPEYEWRTGVRELAVIPAPIPRPRWDGSELNGKRILLYSEQGLGDTIQFARYVPLVAARGGRVTVAVQPEVLPVVRGIGGAESWLEIKKDALPECDVQCSLPSLPGVFRTDLHNIPAGVPYLRAVGGAAERWRTRMPEGKFKVGLCWAGRATHPEDRERSLKLKQLSPLAECGAWLVSLQKGEPARQVAEAAEAAEAGGVVMLDWTDELTDFSQTAGLVEHLDLVITADTAVAHLAGAMGKPVWVLVQFVADWRWMMDRTDSPWYPTMRLFRQEKYGDWSAPVERMARELRELRQRSAR
jgi:tetratricopeptide (TPR) repeat protein